MRTRLLIAIVSLLLANGAHATAATTCDQQLVMQIDSAKVSVEPDGFSIDAFGTSESAGWSKPTLILSKQNGDTAVVDLVGCRPEVSAQVLTPIQASVMLDLPLYTKKVVIRARTNSMTIEMSGN